MKYQNGIHVWPRSTKWKISAHMYQNKINEWLQTGQGGVFTWFEKRWFMRRQKRQLELSGMNVVFMRKKTRQLRTMDALKKSGKLETLFEDSNYEISSAVPDLLCSLRAPHAETKRQLKLFRHERCSCEKNDNSARWTLQKIWQLWQLLWKCKMLYLVWRTWPSTPFESPSKHASYAITSRNSSFR